MIYLLAIVAAGFVWAGYAIESQPRPQLAPPGDDDEAWNRLATINKLRHTETVLKRCHKLKKRQGWKTRKNLWKDNAPPKWQFKSMILKKDAFELFLIKEVWASEGKFFEKFRWKESYLEQRKFIPFKKNKSKIVSYDF